MSPEELDRLFVMMETAYFSAKGEANPVKQAEDWRDCVAAARAYLALGGTRNVHVYLNIALSSLGMVREALDSCAAGLRSEPGQANLVFNSKIYSDFLSKGTMN